MAPRDPIPLFYKNDSFLFLRRIRLFRIYAGFKGGYRRPSNWKWRRCSPTGDGGAVSATGVKAGGNPPRKGGSDGAGEDRNAGTEGAGERVAAAWPAKAADSAVTIWQHAPWHDRHPPLASVAPCLAYSAPRARHLATPTNEDTFLKSSNCFRGKSTTNAATRVLVPTHSNPYKSRFRPVLQKRMRSQCGPIVEYSRGPATPVGLHFSTVFQAAFLIPMSPPQSGEAKPINQSEKR
jgi:hypothetical protein